MLGRSLCVLTVLGLATASAHVCLTTARGQSALRRAPCAKNDMTMIFGNKVRSDPSSS